ncbi:DUF1289 domain-containing protein [Oceaniglobus indicus]|uniref:DUF1289 domain-containing protein n=1 Tax=Oceaniglobus indicus TaxID=2047749 RepID=UPI000C189674|nr:DUF1289 domain-containing protein [Oceaniglobus indicus]
MKDIDPDLIWRREEPLSPCVKVCVVHPVERICIGCYRTTDEIAAWSKLDNETRRALMNELPERAVRLKVRRGGRAGRLRREGSD